VFIEIWGILDPSGVEKRRKFYVNTNDEIPSNDEIQYG